MHLLAYQRASFCLFKPYFKMEDKYFYSVMARMFLNDEPIWMPLYRAQTIDEACAIGLGYFRNCNVPKTEIVICYRIDNSEGELIVFKHA